MKLNGMDIDKLDFILPEPKIDEMDNSRYFIFSQIGKGAIFKEAENMAVKISPLFKDKNKISYALRNILFNLLCGYLIYERTGIKTVVGISLNKNNYVNRKVGEKYFKTRVELDAIKVVKNYLEGQGYINVEKGSFYHETITILDATDKLYNLFDKSDNPDIEYYKKLGVLILKSKTGELDIKPDFESEQKYKLVYYTDNSITDEWTKNLKFINQNNFKHSYSVIFTKQVYINKKGKLIYRSVLTYKYHHLDQRRCQQGVKNDCYCCYASKENTSINPLIAKPDIAKTGTGTTSNMFLNDSDYQQKYTILDSREFQFNRIFNNNFAYNGRFYAPFQNLLKIERATLRIDTEPTVELDYKALHPTMLYHQNNLTPPEDMYGELSNIPREAYKLAVLKVINADNRNDAISSLNEDIRDGNLFLPEGIKTNNVVDILIEHHKVLENKKCFFSGKGRNLMNRDSQIANEIMLHFAKLDKPCLSVHDSFIVKEQDEDELRYVMTDIYRKNFKHDIKIDKK